MPRPQNKQPRPDYVRDRHRPKRSPVTKQLRNDAANKYAKTEPRVPRHKNGAVGGAALIVGGYLNHHILERGPQVTVAKANQQRRKIISVLIPDCHKHRVTNRRQYRALHGVAHEATFAQSLAALQPRRYQPHRQHHKIHSRAARDAKFVASVYCEVIAQNPETKPEKHHIDSQQPSANEEKSVQRQFLPALDQLALAHCNAAVYQESDKRNDQRNPKQEHKIFGVVIDHNAHRGRHCHRDIVAKSVKPNAFGAARGCKDVDGDSGICHSQSTKRSTVQRPYYRKHQHRARRQISAEEYEKQEETPHQNLLPRVRIHEEAAQRTGEDSRDGVARQDKPNHILGGSKCLAKVQRQQRRQQKEKYSIKFADITLQ